MKSIILRKGMCGVKCYIENIHSCYIYNSVMEFINHVMKIKEFRLLICNVTVLEKLAIISKA